MGIPKTIAHKLSDLEDHVFLLVGALSGLNSGENAHLRHLAAELRLLVCLSSGTEGLLWRLADELKVTDDVRLHQIGNVDPSQPLAQSLSFIFAPICEPGRGDPRLPIETYSLRNLIKNHEAVFVAGRGVTHERLIKWLSQEIGSAHEDDEINSTLAELNAILIANVQPFFQVLQSDAVLVLEVAERVLLHSVTSVGYQRRRSIIAAINNAQIPACIAVAAPLSAPAVDPIGGEEGYVYFLLKSDEPRWKELSYTCRFPPIKIGDLTFEATKTSNGFLELRSTGLFGFEFTCRKPIPQINTQGLMILVNWKRPEINVYFNGALVETLVENAQA